MSVSEISFPSFSHVNRKGGSPSITLHPMKVLLPMRRSLEKCTGPISGLVRAEKVHFILKKYKKYDNSIWHANFIKDKNKL